MADIEKITTASSKGQITVPQEFRDALGIAKGTKLVCKIKGGELRVKVVEAHLQAMGDDPVLGQFLGLVGKDITSNGTLFDMPKGIASRMEAAAQEDVDLDEEIEGDVAI